MKKLIFISIICLLYTKGIYAQTEINSFCRDTIFCYDKGTLNLANLELCNPPGGFYTGRGVVDYFERTYDTRVADVGIDTITYKIDQDSCQFYITIIDALAAEAILNTSDSKVCWGETREYSIEPIPYAELYIWNLTNSPLLNYSTLNPYIIITFDDTYSTGELTVKGQNECGIGNESPPFSITVNPRPTFSIVDEDGIIISGEDTVVCKNSRNIYKASMLDSIYHWKVETGGSISGDSTDQFVTVDWNKPDSVGILKLTVINANGCAGTDIQNFKISNTEAPLIPQIWQFGTNILVCSDSTATSYEWKIGQEPKSTKQYCIVEDVNQINNYRVKICYGNCCNETSTAENIPIPMNFDSHILPGDDVSNLIFNIFPNPFEDIITIKTNDNYLTAFEYRLFNQLGIEVSSGSGYRIMAEINVSNLPAGLYFIQAWSEGSNRFTEKIIKN